MKANSQVFALTLTSPAFEDGSIIPKEYTGEGRDVSPELHWDEIPPDTKELALICEDPDAPTAEPWTHWLIFGISPETTSLSKGVPATPEYNGMKQGMNSWDTIGYRGPLPPKGHGNHRYFFKLYALDAPLGLYPRALRSELLKKMKGHVLAESTLIGIYSR